MFEKLPNMVILYCLPKKPKISRNIVKNKLVHSTWLTNYFYFITANPKVLNMTIFFPVLETPPGPNLFAIRGQKCLI